MKFNLSAVVQLCEKRQRVNTERAHEKGKKDQL